MMSRCECDVAGVAVSKSNVHTPSPTSNYLTQLSCFYKIHVLLSCWLLVVGLSWGGGARGSEAIFTHSHVGKIFVGLTC